MKGIMRIKFIRNHRGKKIDDIEDVPNKVGQRYIIRGFAKEIKQRKVNARTRNKSKG